MLWLCGCAEFGKEESDSCASHLPDRGQGLLQGLIHKDFIQLLFVPWEFSLSLVLPKGKQQTLPPNPGWKSETAEEATEKAKWFPQHPLCPGTCRFGEFSLVGRKFHAKFLPSAKILGIT